MRREIDLKRLLEEGIRALKTKGPLRRDQVLRTKGNPEDGAKTSGRVSMRESGSKGDLGCLKRM